MNVSRLLLSLGVLAFCTALVNTPVVAHQETQQHAADDTKTNKDHSLTADQQKMNAADRTTTQKIRKAIREDKSLSFYAHNIKIITRDGKVTLRGPVRSGDEKGNIEGKAAAIAGQDNVTNSLSIAPPK